MTDDTGGTDMVPSEQSSTMHDDHSSASLSDNVSVDQIPLAHRPDGLPDKFWDPEAETVRVDDLVKSYRALESQFSQVRTQTLDPGLQDLGEVPEDYDIALQDGPVSIDPGINEQLKEAGFSNDQAQLVYDLANNYFGELSERLKTEVMLNHQTAILEQHYGGPDRWNQVQDQIKTWADRNLPKSMVDSLAYSAEGILALQQLMAAEEPSILSGISAGEVGLTEDKLRERMKDPRYWRDHDPAIVREIQEGFERLYPND